MGSDIYGTWELTQLTPQKMEGMELTGEQKSLSGLTMLE